LAILQSRGVHIAAEAGIYPLNQVNRQFLELLVLIIGALMSRWIAKSSASVPLRPKPRFLTPFAVMSFLIIVRAGQGLPLDSCFRALTYFTGSAD